MINCAQLIVSRKEGRKEGREGKKEVRKEGLKDAMQIGDIRRYSRYKIKLGGRQNTNFVIMMI